MLVGPRLACLPASRPSPMSPSHAPIVLRTYVRDHPRQRLFPIQSGTPHPGHDDHRRRRRRGGPLGSARRLARPRRHGGEARSALQQGRRSFRHPRNVRTGLNLPETRRALALVESLPSATGSIAEAVERHVASPESRGRLARSTPGAGRPYRRRSARAQEGGRRRPLGHERCPKCSVQIDRHQPNTSGARPATAASS